MYLSSRQSPSSSTPSQHSAVVVALCLVLGSALAACTGSQKPDPDGPQLDPSSFPLSDAPYELASDRDLEDRRDLYRSLADADPGRKALRHKLAREYGRRMTVAMERSETREDAYERLLDLLSLYSASELDTLSPEDRAEELAPFLATVLDMRTRFARSGLDVEATATLYFASIADPDNRARYLAEVDEIFTYADSLARAEYGDGAETSRPITILEALVERAPINSAVDRLVELYIVRQDVIARLFKRPDRRLELIQAHGNGVLLTAFHITRVLARSGRLEEAPRHMDRFQGMGHDKRLIVALDQALVAGATDVSWAALIRYFAEADGREQEAEKLSRLRGGLAVCQAGIERFPRSALMAVCAGEMARELDLMHVAIRYYEDAVAFDPTDREAANDLADLYRVRVSTLALYERPIQALELLRELETFHDRMAKKWPDKPLDTDLADAYASVARGMTSLGELDHATKFLERSLTLRPSSSALEQLGTIAFKQDQNDKAIEYYERALALPTDDVLAEYNRARILRLSGDALARAGLDAEAEHRWKESLSAWTALDSQYDLPPAYKGELLVESGKAQWALGDPETAMAAFDAAVDVDPDGADTHSSVVSFLIVRGQYRPALDAYHRALGSFDISPYSKVYMSLWVLAEARRSGESPDPLAREYLAGRKGTLWHDRLARFATGREAFNTLEQNATTRGQRAELLYYSAVLDDEIESDGIRAAMQRVLDTDMVQFYEYDMAKYWLSEGFAPRAPKAALERP